MSELLLISFAIIIILIFIGIVTAWIVWKRKKEGTLGELNFQAFFTMGITFLALGIVLSSAINNPGFFGFIALGLIYMTIGLANKDKWGKKK